MNDIELGLSDQEIAEVVSIYVLANLREESISVFKENLKEGIREALYKAIFNDSCIDCIEAGIRETNNDN